MVLWGRSVLGCQKFPRKVPPSQSLAVLWSKGLLLQRRFVGGFRQLFFSTCLPIQNNHLKPMAGASEKVLWRVPTTVLYIFPPVSYSTQCCVNSGHLSSIYASTLRRCWGIFGLIRFFCFSLLQFLLFSFLLTLINHIFHTVYLCSFTLHQ